jgi:aconitate hydratase
MGDYLRATQRSEIAALAKSFQHNLSTDPNFEYDQIIEIDLSTLQPHLNGPFTPDWAHPVDSLKEAVAKNGWPAEVKVGLIGSCTNSSYEGMFVTVKTLINHFKTCPDLLPFAVKLWIMD